MRYSVSARKVPGEKTQAPAADSAHSSAVVGRKLYAGHRCCTGFLLTVHSHCWKALALLEAEYLADAEPQSILRNRETKQEASYAGASPGSYAVLGPFHAPPMWPRSGPGW